MLDIRRIRNERERILRGLAAKGYEGDLSELLDWDRERREIQIERDELRSRIRRANDTIVRLRREGGDPASEIAAMKEVSLRIDALETRLQDLSARIDRILIGLPNPPHDSVPEGGAEANRVVRSWGTPRTFDFPPKSHIELAEQWGIIDFKRAARLAGSHFLLYKKEGALLERALIHFMLDLHTRSHGYVEVSPPYLVNSAAMTGTGQLPKMKDDMYFLDGDDLYLIPTAEVPVTNIHRDEILVGEDLPVRYTAYSACFRREAGSYGKDTRGLMRVHQFDKVEMVQFVRPEESYAALEELVGHAEEALQALGLPYRVVELASGDLSFAAAKCYDLEAYASGLDAWLEVSSCSNFEDFQARRAGIRYKDKGMKKPAFVHTLNGSGLALPRTMAALLEHHQTADGRIEVPEVLRPYMGGVTTIGGH